jgi:hypothetical protein
MHIKAKNLTLRGACIEILRFAQDDTVCGLPFKVESAISVRNSHSHHKSHPWMHPPAPLSKLLNFEALLSRGWPCQARP